MTAPLNLSEPRELFKPLRLIFFFTLICIVHFSERLLPKSKPELKSRKYRNVSRYRKPYKETLETKTSIFKERIKTDPHPIQPRDQTVTDLDLNVG